MTATVLKSALMARYPLAIAVGNVSMTIPPGHMPTVTAGGNSKESWI